TTGAAATCALAALIQYRQGLGDARSPMLIGIAGNVVNAVLAWALIHGELGLPALGVKGAACATRVSEALELTVMLVMRVRVRRACPSRSASAGCSGWGSRRGSTSGSRCWRSPRSTRCAPAWEQRRWRRAT